MDRFQRYALIFGPIIGAILFYLIFTTMSGQLQSDQQTLGDLGPVTLQEVSQNPALLTGEGEEEGEVDGEVIVAEVEVEADVAVITATEAMTGAATVTGTEAVTAADAGAEATAAVTTTDELTGTGTVDAAEVITAETVDAAAAVTDTAAVATEAAVTDTVTDTLEVTTAITETPAITTEDEIVIATTVTQTEETLVEMAIAEDVVWFVEQYANGEGELIDVVEDSAITMLLAGNTVSGSTGCSNYAGRYTPGTEGEFLVTLTAISPAGTEIEACVEGGVLNVQEFEYFDALASAVSYVVEGNQFRLSNSAGEVILIYTAAESS